MANKIEKLDVLTAARDYYMTYASSTIAERMFPSLDGLKPGQRRILYSMIEMGITHGKVTKSSKVVGATMGDYHPHGDMSIYETACHMAETYEGLNMPLLTSSGTLGKQWADESVPMASQRYTEIGLSDFTVDNYYGGLKADAVDMVDNYLNEKKEPLLLPVSYPSIIVNTSKGIACGLSSYIPSYTLTNACQSIIELLKGTIKTSEELAQTLGVPDFATGGTVAVSKKQLIDLCRTGETRGIVITSRYKMCPGNILRITEIPYNTTVDKLIEQIGDLVVAKQLPGVSRITNGTGNEEMGINLFLQRGADPNEVFRMLCAFTDVQKNIAFSTKLVIQDPETGKYNLIICGVHELLVKYWIPWRVKTLRRIYAHELKKLKEEEAKIAAWAKVDGHTEEYLNITATNKRAVLSKLHREKFNLTEEEEDYLSGLRVTAYTQDEVEKQLGKLTANLERQKVLNLLLTDDYLVHQEIIKEQENIIKKYGTERKSGVEGLHQVVRLNRKKNTISNKEVFVGLTENGYLKRADTMSEVNTFTSRIPSQDKMKEIFKLRNTDKLLVFSTYGYVYKLAVNLIDNGPKSKFRDTIWQLVEKDPEDKGDAFLVTPAGEYDKEFNIIYPKLLVRKIKTSMYKGRNVYRSSFPGYTPELCTLTDKDQLLLVTDKWNAMYINLVYLNRNKVATKQSLTMKLPPLPEDENIKFAVPIDEIADFDSKLDYFSKGFVPVRKNDLVKKQAQEQPRYSMVDGVEVKETEYTHKETEQDIDIPEGVDLSYLYANVEDEEDDSDF